MTPFSCDEHVFGSGLGETLTGGTDGGSGRTGPWTEGQGTYNDTSIPENPQ
jgi:hypothetical protein